MEYQNRLQGRDPLMGLPSGFRSYVKQRKDMESISDTGSDTEWDFLYTKTRDFLQMTAQFFAAAWLKLSSPEFIYRASEA